MGGHLIVVFPSLTHKQVHLSLLFFPGEVISVQVKRFKSRSKFLTLRIYMYIPPSVTRQRIDSLEELLDSVLSNYPSCTVLITDDFYFFAINGVNCEV